MALYSATDMAGAGTPITETLTAGTTYNLALNSGLFTANPSGSNYFVMEQPTNSTGSYMNIAPKDFDTSTVDLTGIDRDTLLRTPYRLSVACGDSNVTIQFTPQRTIDPNEVIFRSTGNVDLRISAA